MIQGHNTATRVGLEPPTSGSGVQGINHQATAPLNICCNEKIGNYKENEKPYKGILILVVLKIP